MMIDVSINSVFVMAGSVISAMFGLWMRSVSLHNAISEKRSDELKKELDELRDCVQETRETYVTSERFEKVTDNIVGKLDEIMSLLSNKPDRNFCDLKHSRLMEGGK